MVLFPFSLIQEVTVMGILNPIASKFSLALNVPQEIPNKL
jgi:hypothetical protein